MIIKFLLLSDKKVYFTMLSEVKKFKVKKTKTRTNTN